MIDRVDGVSFHGKIYRKVDAPIFAAQFEAAAFVISPRCRVHVSMAA